MKVIKALTLLAQGHTEQNPLQIEGISFWVDQTGPWKNELSYDRPQSQWDMFLICQTLLAGDAL